MRQAVSAVLMGLVAAVAWADPVPVLDPARVSEKTLDNGLRVIVKEERGWGVVALAACIRCGLRYDPPDGPGTGHFVEHMLFRTGERGGEPSDIIATVEGQGGTVNAETNRDSTLVQIVTGPQTLSELWPVLAKTLMEPQFDEAAIREEKKIIAQEVAERQGQAVVALNDALWAAAYPTHPYGRSIGGSREAIAQITAERLREYHARFYVPNNMAIIAVGEVKADALFDQVERAFGRYPRKAVDWAPPADEAPREGPLTDVQTKDVSLTLIGWAFRGPGIADKRAVCAMDVIYTLLSEGRESRLARSLQTPGLATAFELQYITQKDPGLVLLSAAVPPDKELEARAAVQKELERLATEDLSAEELTRVKRILRNSYAFTNEAYSDQTASMAFYEMIDTYRFALDYIDAVNRVTAEDVKRVAAEYLNPEKQVLVIFRPPAPRKPGGEV